MDAIAEVYASTFGPDPIELPRGAGPARFRRRDGHHDPGSRGHAGRAIISSVLRGRRVQPQRVPLVAPDQPRGRPPAIGPRAGHAGGRPHERRLSGPDRPRAARLRVNVTAEEIVRYAPKKVGRHQPENEQLSRPSRSKELLREMRRRNIPAVDKIVSVYDGQCLRKPLRDSSDFEKDDLVVTFDGLVAGPRSSASSGRSCGLLEEKLQSPVDIEFASDGRSLLPAPVPAAELHWRAAARRPSPGPAQRERRLSGQPLRLQRQPARHHPSRLCRPAGLRRADSAERTSWPSAGRSAGSTSSCPGAASS